ncbi:ArnT family glycosyltransferase [Oleisolibacter albus]|uniref:ArnT family glycosyltransferase n=1 Tax=Oleisolibacter albus TaxID=2171757 RepID=UPI000DF2AC65|nr:glycosyltransferase family 39 protein [Oleisolibacter albus]
MSHAPLRLTALKPVHWLLLAVVALAMFLPGFAGIPPFDRDESRYAQASHQMLESGDFVDIRYQDEARHKKPVGIYWLQSASVSLLTGGAEHGPIWMYRIPSLLGAVAAVLLTAWTAARLFGATAGLLAGLALASTVVLGVEARMAKTDAVLLATILLAQGVLARVWLDRDKPIAPSLGLTLLFWLGLGLGILVKGPIILMVTGGTILALWGMERRAGWLKRLRPATGLPLLLAVVLPWLIAIGIATKGEFFTYAIGHEFLGKAGTGQEGHGAPPGYFLATFWLSFWPWPLLALLSVPWIWRNRADDAVRFCLAWIIPSWLVFEIVTTKLPHYTLPVFPAIAALMAAAALHRFSRSEVRKPWLLALAGLLFMVVTLAFAGAIAGFPWQLTQSVSPLALLAGAVILATGSLVLGLEAGREPNRLLAAGLGGAFATYLLVHGLVLPGLSPLWLSPQVQAAVQANRTCPGTVLAAAGYTEPSMVFLVGTRTRLGNGAMVAEHLAADPACALGLVTTGPEEELFQRTLAGAGLADKGLVAVRLVELSGFNYSRGKPATLHLYRLGPAAP